MKVLKHNVTYYASRELAKKAAAQQNGKFVDNGKDADDKRWSVTVAVEDAVTNSPAATTKPPKRGIPVQNGDLKFVSKADAARFAIRDHIVNKRTDSLIKRLMTEAALTKNGARTYKFNMYKKILAEVKAA